MTDQPGEIVGGAVIACELSAHGFAARREEVSRDLFRHVEQVRELGDGYAYRFPSPAPWAGEVFAFVNAERRCCPFFTFEVVFEPHGGPLWLRLRGSADVKAFLQNLLENDPALAARRFRDDVEGG